MSRIGKQPIPVPAGVEVQIDGSNVRVKGPKGSWKKSAPDMIIKYEEGGCWWSGPVKINCTGPRGLTRTLLNNMVVGVTSGFQKNLELVGVGYRAFKQAKNWCLP